METEFLGDEVKRGEPAAQLLELTPENEEERLGRFDLMFELDLFRKNFRRPDEVEEASRGAVGLSPEMGRERSEPGSQLILRKSGELTESMDSPFVENGEDARDFRRLLFRLLHEPE